MENSKTAKKEGEEEKGEVKSPKTPEQILDEMKAVHESFKEMTENLDRLLGSVNYRSLADFAEAASSFRPDKVEEFIEATNALKKMDADSFGDNVRTLKMLDIDGITAAANVLKSFNLEDFAYAADCAAQAAKTLAELR